MIHSKSIDVLKTFSKEELKQFSDFVRSPLHNKNKNLIKLFEELKKYHPDYNVENEKLFERVYSGKVYNHDSMKKLTSELLGLAEEYLRFTGLKKENFENEFFFLKVLEYRRLDSLF